MACGKSEILQQMWWAEWLKFERGSWYCNYDFDNISKFARKDPNIEQIWKMKQ